MQVSSLVYSAEYKRLVSAGEDCRLVCWDTASTRLETPDWATSDTCQLCSRPFFWNLRAMYDQKQIGLRQHHCRRCGKAVCDYCSSKRTVLTERGHEYPVRVCEECYISVTEAEKRPMANFFDTRFGFSLISKCLLDSYRTIVNHLHFDPGRHLLATVTQDNVIKIWNIKEMLEADAMRGP